MRASHPASPMLTVLLAVTTLLSIAALDFVSGTELSFSLFYLAPISLLAWRTGWMGGVVASLAGAVVWYVVDAAGGHVYANPLIPLWNSFVRLGFFLIVTVLLVQICRSMERESALARTDHLTGLLNRRAFLELASREIDRSGRTGVPLSFAYIDLDGFKGINDRLGHAAGDEMLRTVGRVLDLVLRGVDLKSRLGGDEFAVVLPDTPAPAAKSAVERLSAGFAAAGVACSIGTVVFETPPADVDTALAAVDSVMYEVKGSSTKQPVISVVGAPPAPLRAALSSGSRGPLVVDGMRQDEEP